MIAVEPPGVLDQPAFEGKRHGEDERIELRKVKAFANERGGCQQDEWNVLPVMLVDTMANARPGFLSHTAFQPIARDGPGDSMRRQRGFDLVEIGLAISEH